MAQQFDNPIDLLDSMKKPQEEIKDDYDLIRGFMREGGHGFNWKGYADEWNDVRKAGFDIPEKRNGYNFSFDPSTRTAYIFKFKGDNVDMIPIKRIIQK